MKNWPDETRIDLIGHNGPTGDHYKTIKQFKEIPTLVQSERSKQSGDKNGASNKRTGKAHNTIKAG